MFCAFDKPPMILRLYGEGRAIPRGSDEYAALLAAHFGGDELIGARQMIRIDFDLVKTSCGYGVPFFDYHRRARHTRPLGRGQGTRRHRRLPRAEERRQHGRAAPPAIPGVDEIEPAE